MTKGKQGFASLPPAQRTAIAVLGGQAAHRKGTAHEFTPAEARLAGIKGGQALQAKRRAAKAAKTGEVTS